MWKYNVVTVYNAFLSINCITQLLIVKSTN